MVQFSTDYDPQTVLEQTIAQQQALASHTESILADLWQHILNNTANKEEACGFFLVILEQWRYTIAAARTYRPTKRKPVPRTLRQEVMERDAYRCVICGDWHNLQLDHINPVAYGGENTAANLRVLCGDCNSDKGAL